VLKILEYNINYENSKIFNLTIIVSYKISYSKKVKEWLICKVIIITYYLITQT
jgi:hypothetical protein